MVLMKKKLYHHVSIVVLNKPFFKLLCHYHGINKKKLYYHVSIML